MNNMEYVLLCHNFPSITFIFDSFYSKLRASLSKIYEAKSMQLKMPMIKNHELNKVCEYFYRTNQHTMRCICSLDFHLMGRLMEVITLTYSQIEVKCYDDTFFNCLMVTLNLSTMFYNWYNKPLYDCKASNSNDNATLTKMRKLINTCHYLAKESYSVLEWYKLSHNRRQHDWQSKLLERSLSIQDIVRDKLNQYRTKSITKNPLFWQTYKLFESNQIIQENYP